MLPVLNNIRPTICTIFSSIRKGNYFKNRKIKKKRVIKIKYKQNTLRQRKST